MNYILFVIALCAMAYGLIIILSDNDSPATKEARSSDIAKQLLNTAESLRKGAFVKETHDLRAALHFTASVISESGPYLDQSDLVSDLCFDNVPRLLNIIRSNMGVPLAKELADTMFSLSSQALENMIAIEKRDFRMAQYSVNDIRDKSGSPIIFAESHYKSRYDQMMSYASDITRYFTAMGEKRIPLPVICDLSPATHNNPSLYAQTIEYLSEAYATSDFNKLRDFRFGDKTMYLPNFSKNLEMSMSNLIKSIEA